MQAMIALADKHAPRETGGMLLGYNADNGDTVATTIIGPGPRAKHRRFGFVPDPDYQQSLLEEHFYATNGRETYLGDWHTHPGGSAHLSFTDKRTLARIARTETSGTSYPIMAIIGGYRDSWCIEAVRFIRVQRKLIVDGYDLMSLEIIRF